jgi:hypothetical protein
MSPDLCVIRDFNQTLATEFSNQTIEPAFIMVLIASFIVEVLGFIFGVFFELIGAGIWGMFEALFTKSPVAALFFLIGLVISLILFCTMGNSLHAAMWSVAEIVLLLVLGFVIESAGK